MICRIYEKQLQIQETCAIISHADRTPPARKHRLGRSDHVDQGSIYLLVDVRISI